MTVVPTASGTAKTPIPCRMLPVDAMRISSKSRHRDVAAGHFSWSSKNLLEENLTLPVSNLIFL
jgi:hypothetical protein